jgi:hypothetical protein
VVFIDLEFIDEGRSLALYFSLIPNRPPENAAEENATSDQNHRHGPGLKGNRHGEAAEEYRDRTCRP